MKQYLVTWKDGHTETLPGHMIFDALVRAGYGSQSIDAVRSYKQAAVYRSNEQMEFDFEEGD